MQNQPEAKTKVENYKQSVWNLSEKSYAYCGNHSKQWRW